MLSVRNWELGQVLHCSKHLPVIILSDHLKFLAFNVKLYNFFQKYSSLDSSCNIQHLTIVRGAPCEFLNSC